MKDDATLLNEALTPWRSPETFDATVGTATAALDLLAQACEPVSNATGCEITIETFDGLAVDAARKAGAGIILRGLRDASDFDYEVQMGQMNAGLAPDIETVFLAASPATRMIASSLVKQIAKMGGDISTFVPEAVNSAVLETLKTQ